VLGQPLLQHSTADLEIESPAARWHGLTHICDLLVGNGCRDLLDLQNSRQSVSIGSCWLGLGSPRTMLHTLTLSHAAAHSPALPPPAHFSSASLMAISTAALSCMQNGIGVTTNVSLGSRTLHWRHSNVDLTLCTNQAACAGQWEQ